MTPATYQRWAQARNKQVWWAGRVPLSRCKGGPPLLLPVALSFTGCNGMAGCIPQQNPLSSCQGSAVLSVSICRWRKSFLVFSSMGIPALPWLNITSGLPLLLYGGGWGFLLLQQPQSTFALLLAFLMPSSLLHLAALCPDKSTDPACEAAVTPNLWEAPGSPCSLHPHSHVCPRVAPGLRSPVCHDSCSG